MADINQLTVSGRLTKDCEVRAAGDNFAVNFSIACNDSKKDSEGNWVDVPNFFEVTRFVKDPERLRQALRRGEKVVVSGKLKWREWEQDGQRRTAVSILASNVEYFIPRKSSDSGSYRSQDLSAYDEEIPF